MKRVIAMTLIGLLVAPPASAGQKQGKPIDWQKAQKLKARNRDRPHGHGEPAHEGPPVVRGRGNPRDAQTHRPEAAGRCRETAVQCRPRVARDLRHRRDVQQRAPTSVTGRHLRPRQEAGRTLGGGETDATRERTGDRGTSAQPRWAQHRDRGRCRSRRVTDHYGYRPIFPVLGVGHPQTASGEALAVCSQTDDSAVALVVYA